ncbi:MAG TPA: NDP-sugar synthase [Bryobacteraceae bacterium]|nr:NDP-sugar synthase [Bryobacteraceae bacterium]
MVDRPFMHHVVEAIVGQGVHELDFILPDKDHVIVSILGSGTRWGARFRYYPVAPNGCMYDAIQQIIWEDPQERVLLAHSDRLPLVRLDSNGSASTLFCWEDKDRYWTGWALVRPADLLRIPKGTEEPGILAFFLRSLPDLVYHSCACPLTARTYDELLESNRRVLAGEFPGLLLGGKEVKPGIWMARNVKVHPSANVAAPAFLGENCRIGAMAQVGPGTSIGRDCLIERETRVTDSVVCEGSYVGRQLALRGVVVDRSRLFNTACDAEIDGVDDLLLGSVFGHSLRRRTRRGLSRVGATAALLFLAPLFLAIFLASKARLAPPLKKRLIVLTPTVAEAYRWNTFELLSFGEYESFAGSSNWLRHFCFCFLPALLAIADGYMRFGGPRPRTGEEIEQLPLGRRLTYLRLRCGALQPFFTGVQKDDDLDLFENSGTGWRETLGLIRAYANRVVRSIPAAMRNLSLRSAAE